MSLLGKWSRTQDVITAFPEGCRELAKLTTIVTGANTGIGKETAGALASLGGRVVFACRDVLKGEQAVEEMMLAYPKAIMSATCLRLDLSSLQGVSDFVRDFRECSARESWPPLGCLVLNAGIFALDPAAPLSGDGLDMSFQVNHLSQYLLTRLLLPELSLAGSSRVVVVSSVSHRGPHITQDVTNKEVLLNSLAKPQPDLGGSSMSLFMGAFASAGGDVNLSRSSMGVYGSSKLCNVLFARELQDREFAASGVAACSLHPGTAIATDIGRDSQLATFVMKRVMSFFTKDVNQGASTTVYCALCPRDGLAGLYFDDCAAAPQTASPLATGEEGKKAATVLWELSGELCRSFL
ncbi:unnamed protein product [Polarella glacialis]|uniref:Protochlorophyllide reductase n=1 Tax=Polarella glacialis TaxID=89957 RepID=A0A813HLA0_POLGL|nr:unnamed protein product [Polarella glacialis]